MRRIIETPGADMPPACWRCGSQSRATERLDPATAWAACPACGCIAATDRRLVAQLLRADIRSLAEIVSGSLGYHVHRLGDGVAFALRCPRCATRGHAAICCSPTAWTIGDEWRCARCEARGCIDDLRALVLADPALRCRARSMSGGAA